MKKIFLIFTLFVSSYVFSEERGFYDYDNVQPYEVCSDYRLYALVGCVRLYLTKGYKAQSGVHAVQTPEGTLFFQSVVRK